MDWMNKKNEKLLQEQRNESFFIYIFIFFSPSLKEKYFFKDFINLIIFYEKKITLNRI